MFDHERSAAYEATRAPKLLRWDVNSKCNLACSHCCVGDSLRDDTIKDLTPDEFQQSLKKAAAQGVESVHFLGGEPTIRKDFLEILRTAHDAGMKISFNTNGIRQDQKYLDAIFETDVRKVVVSIDGPDALSHDLIRGVGTFSKTCSFVRKLVEAKTRRNSDLPLIQIQTVLTSAWSDRARAMVQLCASLGAGGLKVSSLSEFGDARTNWDRLKVDVAQQFKALMCLLDCVIDHPDIVIDLPVKPKVYRLHRKYSVEKLVPSRFGCPAVHDNIHIGPDGNVSPCQLADAQKVDHDFAKLDVREVDFSQLTNSERFNGFHERVQKPDNAKLYAHQVPCNRCEFNGLYCNPCPLPAKSGFYTTNYLCLIAEKLTPMVGDSGRPDWDQLMNEILAAVGDNPPRPIGAP